MTHIHLTDYGPWPWDEENGGRECPICCMREALITMREWPCNSLLLVTEAAMAEAGWPSDG